MERLRCAAHKITTFPRFLQDRVIWRELRSHVVEQPLGVTHKTSICPREHSPESEGTVTKP